MKFWKKLLFILWLALSFVIPVGCQSSLTYDQMIELHRSSDDPGERAALETRILRFEADAHAANMYFEGMKECPRLSEYVWFCNSPSHDRRRIEYLLSPERTMDGRVKLYRTMRRECGCVPKYVLGL